MVLAPGSYPPLFYFLTMWDYSFSDPSMTPFTKYFWKKG